MCNESHSSRGGCFLSLWLLYFNMDHDCQHGTPVRSHQVCWLWLSQVLVSTWAILLYLHQLSWYENLLPCPPHLPSHWLLDDSVKIYDHLTGGFFRPQQPRLLRSTFTWGYVIPILMSQNLYHLMLLNVISSLPRFPDEGSTWIMGQGSSGVGEDHCRGVQKAHRKHAQKVKRSC